MYSTGQYNNRPVPYESAYQYYISFLNGSNPNVQYPYDAQFDSKYQNDVVNPTYSTNVGEMNYPYYVQRHRSPEVFYDPKPTKYYNPVDNHIYQIPQYPPYMYWYPAPSECRDTCGKKVCDSYYKAMNDNRNCQRCQRKDPPQCWDSQIESCVDCPRSTALASCNSRNSYGCANPRGFPHSDGAPINPMYTGCKLCSRK